jgi:hypothetical protein
MRRHTEHRRQLPGRLVKIRGTILGTCLRYSRYLSPKILRNRRSSINIPKRK